MTWTVILAKAARKQLAGFPVRDQDSIATALKQMADDPFSGDIVKLEGERNCWRKRVGSYRIFYTVDSSARSVAISAILRRTSNTY